MDASTSSETRRRARLRALGIGFIAASAAAAVIWIVAGPDNRAALSVFSPSAGNDVQPYQRILAEDASTAPASLIVEWQEGNDALRRATVNREALKAFILTRLDASRKERAVLQETSVRYLRFRIDPIFDRMKRRVKTYTTWMYGWAASYVKAYMLVGRGLWKSLGVIADGNTETLANDLETDLTDFVMTEFRETVLKPEESDTEIRRAWDDTVVFIGSEWARMRLDARQEFRTFLNSQDARSQVINQATAASGHPNRPALPKSDTADVKNLPKIFAGSPTGNTLGEELVVDGIVARSVRPWLSRVVGITLQSAAAGTAAAAGGVALPVAGPGIGLVVGVTTFLAYHWAFDFIVNEVDEGLNRKGVESSLKAAIDDGRISLNETLAKELTARMNIAFDDASGAMKKDQVSLGIGLVLRVRKPAPL